MIGKAYLNKKTKKLKPENDLYDTPKSLVWELLKIRKLKNVYEPAYGNGSISEEFEKLNLLSEKGDIKYGQDFLKRKNKHKGIIVTNPPFYLWNDFVIKALEICNKFYFIGRLNYFASKNRMKMNIWKYLKSVFVFNRMVDYRTPYRKDGKFNCGGLVTGWFEFNVNNKNKTIIDVIDVDKYVIRKNLSSKTFKQI